MNKTHLDKARASIGNAIQRFTDYMVRFKSGLPSEHFRTWSMAHSMNCDCVEALEALKSFEEDNQPHGPKCGDIPPFPDPTPKLEQWITESVKPKAEPEKKPSPVQVKPIVITGERGEFRRKEHRDWCLPAENALTRAIHEVSYLGDSDTVKELLETLSKAQSKLSDYVDKKLSEHQ